MGLSENNSLSLHVIVETSYHQTNDDRPKQTKSAQISMGGGFDSVMVSSQDYGFETDGKFVIRYSTWVHSLFKD